MAEKRVITGHIKAGSFEEALEKATYRAGKSAILSVSLTHDGDRDFHYTVETLSEAKAAV